ncbi:MAG TPA: response regulator [Kiritimatiellia bacterium]|nr:response regulator [Kiritimatiellia bacterium]
MRKILSVDDDDAILRCFQRALDGRGYKVFVTTDPAEVSKILEEHELDLVMLDIHMPKKDGFEIFQELKRQKKKLPVLFVTAYPKSFSMEDQKVLELWQNEFADGNTDVLYKPFKLERLFEKVESLIGPPAEDGE